MTEMDNGWVEVPAVQEPIVRTRFEKKNLPQYLQPPFSPLPAVNLFTYSGPTTASKKILGRYLYLPEMETRLPL